MDDGDFKTKKDSGRLWRKIEHRVEGQVVEGVAEDGQTHLLYPRPPIHHHPYPTHPQVRPSPISLLRSHNSSAAPLPNEIDTDFIAPYVILLINLRTRFISVRGMEVDGILCENEE